MNPLKRFLGFVLYFCEHKQIHAFKVHLNNRIYYVCARCSGLYLGIFSGFPIAIILHLWLPFVDLFGDLGTTAIAILLALPAMLDWTTQRLALRDSRNAIRFWTALPAGFSLPWYLLSPVILLVKLPVLIGVLAFLIVFGFIDRRTLEYEPREQQPKTIQPTEIISHS